MNGAGAREASNNFLLDGVDNNDLFLNRLLVTPSLDAVQEFTLLTNTYDAAVRTQRRRAGERRLEVGQRPHARLDVRVLPRPCARGARPASIRRPSPSRSAGVTSPAAPSAARSRSWQASTSSASKARAIAGRHARRARARRRRAGRRLQRAAAPPSSTRSPASRSRATGFPRRGSTRPACAMARTLPAAEPRRDDGQLRLVAHRAATTRGSSPAAPISTRRTRSAAVRALQLRARRQRRGVSRTRARTCPGFGTRTVDDTQNLGGRLAREPSGRARSTSCASAGIACATTCFPTTPASTASRALGMTGPSLGPDDLGYPALVDDRLRPLGDDVSLPVVRQHAHAARHRHAERRARPAFHQGRRRVPALPVRRLQPSVRARTVRPSRARSPATPLPICCSGYRRSRCSPPTTTRRRSGRPAINLFAQDDWRLHDRLTINAGLRYEFNAPPSTPTIAWRSSTRPRHAAAGGAARRAARRRRDRPANFAPRVGVSWDMRRRRQPAAARRLRHLLRQRHADRELGALLQPAVLRRCSSSCPVRSGPTARSVSRRAAASPAGRRSTRSIRVFRPATRTRGASASKGASGRRRCPRGASARAACTWCASAT